MTDPALHPAKLSDEQLLTSCSFQSTRRGGPGGQHRNKVETAVVLIHIPTGVRAEANESRSQAQNRGKAILRLKQALAEQIRVPVELHSAPSDLWKSRSRGRKLNVSCENSDFAALLAEALDRVVLHEFDLGTAAQDLGVTTTQLARFLQQSPISWKAINTERQARGLRPLR